MMEHCHWLALEVHMVTRESTKHVGLEDSYTMRIESRKKREKNGNDMKILSRLQRCLIMQMRLIDKYNKNKTSRGGPRRPQQEMATPHQCACCRRPLGWCQRMLSVPWQFPQHSNFTNTHFLTIDWSSFPHIHITSFLVLNSLKSLTCQNRLSHIRVYGSILYAVDGFYPVLLWTF